MSQVVQNNLPVIIIVFYILVIAFVIWRTIKSTRTGEADTFLALRLPVTGVRSDRAVISAQRIPATGFMSAIDGALKYLDKYCKIEPRGNCGPAIAAESQVVVARFNNQRNPVEQTVDTAAPAIGYLRGEELKNFVPTLLQPVRDSISKMLDALKEKSLARTYEAIAAYEWGILSRGQRNDNAENNFAEFTKDLEICQDALMNRKSPGEARQVMNKWHQRWKNAKNGKNVLPQSSMPLALFVTEAVRGLYGESEEWIEESVHFEEIQLVAEFLDKTRAALAGKNTAERMKLLYDCRWKLSQRWT